jgi:hypothetical protein
MTGVDRDAGLVVGCASVLGKDSSFGVDRFRNDILILDEEDVFDSASSSTHARVEGESGCRCEDRFGLTPKASGESIGVTAVEGGEGGKPLDVMIFKEG